MQPASQVSRLASGALNLDFTEDPIIVSANRGADILPYTKRLFEQDVKWRFILPCDFPSKAAREVEESFLDECFGPREIHMQGGIQSGEGYRFCKAAWFAMAEWNLYYRVPMIVEHWIKCNRDLVNDPSMRDFFYKPGIQLSTFFDKDWIDMYQPAFLERSASHPGLLDLAVLLLQKKLFQSSEPSWTIAESSQTTTASFSQADEALVRIDDPHVVDVARVVRKASPDARPALIAEKSRAPTNPSIEGEPHPKPTNRENERQALGSMPLKATAEPYIASRYRNPMFRTRRWSDERKGSFYQCGGSSGKRRVNSNEKHYFVAAQADSGLPVCSQSQAGLPRYAQQHFMSFDAPIPLGGHGPQRTSLMQTAARGHHYDQVGAALASQIPDSTNTGTRGPEVLQSSQRPSQDLETFQHAKSGQTRASHTQARAPHGWLATDPGSNWPMVPQSFDGQKQIRNSTLFRGRAVHSKYGKSERGKRSSSDLGQRMSGEDYALGFFNPGYRDRPPFESTNMDLPERYFHGTNWDHTGHVTNAMSLRPLPCVSGKTTHIASGCQDSSRNMHEQLSIGHPSFDICRKPAEQGPGSYFQHGMILKTNNALCTVGCSKDFVHPDCTTITTLIVFASPRSVNDEDVKQMLSRSGLVQSTKMVPTSMGGKLLFVDFETPDAVRTFFARRETSLAQNLQQLRFEVPRSHYDPTRHQHRRSGYQHPISTQRSVRATSQLSARSDAGFPRMSPQGATERAVSGDLTQGAALMDPQAHETLTYHDAGGTNEVSWASTSKQKTKNTHKKKNRKKPHLDCDAFGESLAKDTPEDQDTTAQRSAKASDDSQEREKLGVIDMWAPVNHKDPERDLPSALATKPLEPHTSDKEVETKHTPPPRYSEQSRDCSGEPPKTYKERSKVGSDTSNHDDTVQSNNADVVTDHAAIDKFECRASERNISHRDEYSTTSTTVDVIRISESTIDESKSIQVEQPLTPVRSTSVGTTRSKTTDASEHAPGEVPEIGTRHTRVSDEVPSKEATQNFRTASRSVVDNFCFATLEAARREDVESGSATSNTAKSSTANGSDAESDTSLPADPVVTVSSQKQHVNKEDIQPLHRPPQRTFACIAAVPKLSKQAPMEASCVKQSTSGGSAPRNASNSSTSGFVTAPTTPSVMPTSIMEAPQSKKETRSKGPPVTESLSQFSRQHKNKASKVKDSVRGKARVKTSDLTASHDSATVIPVPTNAIAFNAEIAHTDKNRVSSTPPRSTLGGSLDPPLTTVVDPIQINITGEPHNKQKNADQAEYGVQGGDPDNRTTFHVSQVKAEQSPSDPGSGDNADRSVSRDRQDSVVKSIFSNILGKNKQPKTGLRTGCASGAPMLPQGKDDVTSIGDGDIGKNNGEEMQRCSGSAPNTLGVLNAASHQKKKRPKKKRTMIRAFTSDPLFDHEREADAETTESNAIIRDDTFPNAFRTAPTASEATTVVEPSPAARRIESEVNRAHHLVEARPSRRKPKRVVSHRSSDLAGRPGGLQLQYKTAKPAYEDLHEVRRPIVLLVSDLEPARGQATVGGSGNQLSRADQNQQGTTFRDYDYEPQDERQRYAFSGVRSGHAEIPSSERPFERDVETDHDGIDQPNSAILASRQRLKTLSQSNTEAPQLPELDEASGTKRDTEEAHNIKVEAVADEPLDNEVAE